MHWPGSTEDWDWKLKKFNLVNYSDDLGRVEHDLQKATESLDK